MGVYLASIHFVIQSFHMTFPQPPFLLPVLDQGSNGTEVLISS